MGYEKLQKTATYTVYMLKCLFACNIFFRMKGTMLTLYYAQLMDQ
jgi:hypothetical protein